MGCPAEDCRAAAPPQRDLAPSERDGIGNPPWVGMAQRCTYCGCVYTREVGGHSYIRGWYDSMLGPGWRPHRNA